MATLVELQAVPNRILQLVKARILANRSRFLKQQEKAQTVSLRPRPQRQRFGARSDDYRKPEPAATKSQLPGYWFTMAAWWYGPHLYGTDPPSWATAGVQVMKPVKLYVQGKDETTVIDTFAGTASNVVADILNGVAADQQNGFPQLTGDETIAGEPFEAALGSYRRATPVNTPGAYEYDASNYTFFSFRQPPCATPSGLHYKFYFNMYVEEQTECEVSHAFQSTHLYGKQTTPVYRPLDFKGNEYPLMDVGHVHAVASYVYAYRIVYPLGGGSVHLYIASQYTKEGITSITSAGQSLFQAGDTVWVYMNFNDIAIGQRYRAFTVAVVETGTFSYQTSSAPGASTATHTGTRMVVVPVSGDTGFEGYGVDYYAIASHFFPTLQDIRDDLFGPKLFTHWDDRYGLTTAYNQWIKQDTAGRLNEPPVPAQAENGFVGSSDILGEFVECSKAGKAYVVFQIGIWKDDPVYAPDVISPHDLGASQEITVHRPYNLPGDPKTRRTATVRLKFLEIDCKTNTVLKEEGPYEYDMGDEENADKTTWANMPDWIPSKRYRAAGWMGGQLNFDQVESYHTEVYYEWQTQKYFLKRQPLPQSQGIEAVVAELQNPTQPAELQPINEIDAENIAWAVGGVYDPRNPPRPARYGYSYSSSYYVAE